MFLQGGLLERLKKFTQKKSALFGPKMAFSKLDISLHVLLLSEQVSYYG
mgnify:CR=1 FL=1